MTRVFTLALCAIILLTVVPARATACVANSMDLVYDITWVAECTVVGVIFGIGGGVVCSLVAVITSHYFDEGTDDYCDEQEGSS